MEVNAFKNYGKLAAHQVCHAVTCASPWTQLHLQFWAVITTICLQNFIFYNLSGLYKGVVLGLFQENRECEFRSSVMSVGMLLIVGAAPGC